MYDVFFKASNTQMNQSLNTHYANQTLHKVKKLPVFIYDSYLTPSYSKYMYCVIKINGLA